jgi:hypothetical protein
MVQALASEWGYRHDVVDSDLTRIETPRPPRRRRRKQT